MKNAFTFKGEQLTLAKSKEPLNIRWSRTFEGEPTSIIVKPNSKREIDDDGAF